jgi:hypothetical protein
MNANVTSQTSQVLSIAEDAYRSAVDPRYISYPILADIINNKIATIIKEDSNLSSAVNCESDQSWITALYYSITSNIYGDVSSAKKYVYNNILTDIGITRETEIQLVVANKVIEAIFKRLEIAKRIEQTNPINERSKEFYTKYFQEKIDESTFLYNVLNEETPLLIMAGQRDEESSLNVLPIELILHISSHFPRIG